MFINNSMRAGSLRFFDTPLLAAGFFICPKKFVKPFRNLLAPYSLPFTLT